MSSSENMKTTTLASTTSRVVKTYGCHREFDTSIALQAQGPPVFDLLFLSTSLGKYSPGPAVFDRMHFQNTSQKNVRYTNPSCAEGGLSVS